MSDSRPTLWHLPVSHYSEKARERFRASLQERRGYRWVEEMYRRHRR